MTSDKLVYIALVGEFGARLARIIIYCPLYLSGTVSGVESRNISFHCRA